MTFHGCRLIFECDSCGDNWFVAVDSDLENIPSITSLAEHTFDERAREVDPSPERNGNQHICSACVLKRELEKLES